VEQGDAERIFEVLPEADAEVVQALAQALLARENVPAEAAGKALAADKVRAVEVAAHVLGRAAGKAPAELAGAIDHWIAQWEKNQEASGDDWEAAQRLESIRDCLTRLVWAAGRTAADPAMLVKVLDTRLDDQGFDYIRHAALLAIGDSPKKPGKATLDAVTARLEDHHPTIRALAASVLAKHDPARVPAAIPAALGDRSRLNSFARAGLAAGKQLEEAVADAHQQAVVLPHLLRDSDLKTLAAVAANGKLPDTARLGAIEGLAAIASKKAEDELLKVAKQKGLDEDLCKAAWRGLRRSKRARAKQEARVSN
jgi:ParB family chromosome partitioning protein